MTIRSAAVLLGFLAVFSGCDGGYDPPEEANPFDTIAPAPADSAIVGSAAGHPSTARV